jgi:hypothetical protein
VVCKPLYQLVVACAFVGARCPRDLSCSALFLVCVFHDGSVEHFFSFSMIYLQQNKKKGRRPKGRKNVTLKLG